MKLIVAALAMLAAIAFVVTGTGPDPAPEADPADQAKVPRVEVHVLRRASRQDVITTYGQVQPRWQIRLRAETSGRILRVSDEALAGATVQKGDTLAVVEDTAQRLELANKTAELSTARRALAEEQQRARLARDNWAAVGYKDAPDPLVLREPQLIEAQARLDTAKLAVDRARYVLNQTRIVAPFDGAILSRSVGPGDLVQVGDQIVEMYDTAHIEVRLPLTEVERARLGEPVGAGVKLTSDISGQSWAGRVTRVGQRVDSTNRWIDLLVSVPEPDGLLPGQFLRAEVDGRWHDGLIGIPRALIARDGAVWHVGFDDQLRRISVTPVFSRGDYVFVESGSDTPPVFRLAVPSRSFLEGMLVIPVLMSDADTLSMFDVGDGQ
ncbi:efflux RND transporter periplasmic adaptor subunit [Tropicibacter sp. R16_0]|uniref:efflux RND transporter periplasmic adaptor subunit n=1 Tax=Tropicibacter sp. R16_0 TaxID=2821102 RepID=UPI001AD9E2B6|nr:efflux RND transporter periplasmic adaptor subunit [Tropicibacter sp. R16_0]MBO9451298.1 efflux RND transporter periplasmic adaptor subunit [Tropicibacter sp. R16_0]